jgi:hypothetical protein
VSTPHRNDLFEMWFRSMSPAGAPYTIVREPYSKKPIAIEMRWEIDDAVEVGYVLQRAGLDKDGVVRDQGFYDDGTIMLEAAWLAQDELKQLALEKELRT